MKNIILGLFMICVFCIVPVLAAGLVQTDEISQSKDIVLRFVEFKDYEVSFIGSEETGHGNYHIFETKDASVYYVNIDTKNIERVDKKFNRKQTTDVKITQKDAVVAAQNYIDKYSVAQDRPGLNTVTSRLLDHGAYKEYYVEFKEKVDGVFVPNMAFVSINPSNGELLSYMSVYQNTKISLKSQITEDEALKVAAEQYPGIQVSSKEAYLQVIFMPDNEQRLVWMITIIGEPVNKIAYGGYLAVDAIDGEVLYNSPFK